MGSSLEVDLCNFGNLTIKKNCLGDWRVCDKRFFFFIVNACSMRFKLDLGRDNVQSRLNLVTL